MLRMVLPAPLSSCCTVRCGEPPFSLLQHALWELPSHPILDLKQRLQHRGCALYSIFHPFHHSFPSQERRTSTRDGVIQMPMLNL